MQLTYQTDYSLRVLLFVAHIDKATTIDEISECLQVSRNHLTKVVHKLSKLGYLNTQRGRGGGITIGCPPQEISIKDVVAKVEPNFHIVECFNPENNHCNLTPMCKLSGVINEAKRQFFNSLERYSLQDLMNPEGFKSTFPNLVSSPRN